jgi:hypothetical protein
MMVCRGRCKKQGFRYTKYYFSVQLQPVPGENCLNSMSYNFSGLYNNFVQLFSKNISPVKLLKVLKKPRLAGLFFAAGWRNLGLTWLGLRRGSSCSRLPSQVLLQGAGFRLCNRGSRCRTTYHGLQRRIPQLDCVPVAGQDFSEGPCRHLHGIPGRFHCRSGLLRRREFRNRGIIWK